MAEGFAGFYVGVATATAWWFAPQGKDRLDFAIRLVLSAFWPVTFGISTWLRVSGRI